MQKATSRIAKKLANILRATFAGLSLLFVISIMIVASSALKSPIYTLIPTGLTLISGWGWMRSHHYIKAAEKDNLQKENGLLKERLAGADESTSPQKNLKSLMVAQKISLIWRSIGTIRGFFSMSASSFAAMGKVFLVKIAGTSSTILVYTESITENIALNMEIRALRKENHELQSSTEPSNSNLKPKAIALYFSTKLCLTASCLSAISVVSNILLSTFVDGANTVTIYTLPLSVVFMLFSTLLASRTNNGRLQAIRSILQQENRNLLHQFKEINSEYSPSETARLVHKDQQINAHDTYARILLGFPRGVKHSTTFRGFLSTVATVSTYTHVLPEIALRVIGATIIILSFAESAAENSYYECYTGILAQENKTIRNHLLGDPQSYVSEQFQDDKEDAQEALLEQVLTV